MRGSVEHNLAQLTSQMVNKLAQIKMRLERMHDRLDCRLDLVEDPAAV